MSDALREMTVAVQVYRGANTVGSLVKTFDGKWLATWNSPTEERPLATTQVTADTYAAALSLIAVNGKPVPERA